MPVMAPRLQGDRRRSVRSADDDIRRGVVRVRGSRDRKREGAVRAALRAPVGRLRRRDTSGSRRSTPRRPRRASSGTTAAYAIASTLSYSSRVPTAEELYANGPHIATFSFEVGDDDLDLEKSVGLDVALQKGLGARGGRSEPVRHALHGLHLRAGHRNDVHDRGRRRAPHHPVHPGPAQFYGAEAHVDFGLVHADPHHLDLELKGDYVHAELTDLNEPVPLQPPLRASLGLKYQGQRAVGVDRGGVGRQAEPVRRVRHRDAQLHLGQRGGRLSVHRRPHGARLHLARREPDRQARVQLGIAVPFRGSASGSRRERQLSLGVLIVAGAGRFERVSCPRSFTGCADRRLACAPKTAPSVAAGIRHRDGNSLRRIFVYFGDPGGRGRVAMVDPEPSHEAVFRKKAFKTAPNGPAEREKSPQISEHFIPERLPTGPYSAVIRFVDAASRRRANSPSP